MTDEEPVICPGCKAEIDPDCCWCGSEEKYHGWGFSNHGFIPIGCNCFRAKPEDEEPPPPF